MRKKLTRDQQGLVSNVFVEVIVDTVDLVAEELNLTEPIGLKIFMEARVEDSLTWGFIDPRKADTIYMNFATVNYFERLDRWLMNTAMVAAHEARHIFQVVNGQDLLAEQTIQYEEQPCELDANQYAKRFLKNEKLLSLIGKKLDLLCEHGIEC